MIDENFGAMHHRFLFIEYQPGVSIAPHDHTFEEAYFILSGEVEGTLDGKWYRAQAGDVLWTSVGCVHTFVNTSREPVRWLETFSPQPAKENVVRFVAEWQEEAKELEGASRRPARVPIPTPNISRTFATAARSGSTANASRTSRPIRRSATRCG